MPMEVGVFRNCCWYACAAATPELALPVEDPVGLLPLVVLPLLGLLVLLLLHAAMVNAEIPAMTNVRVFLIDAASPWHALGRTEQPESYAHQRLTSGY